MDTQTELPSHIKIGNYVKIAEWIGKIADIAYGENHVMLLVVSPKQVYRHSSPEWLQLFSNGAPMIFSATRDDWNKECAFYASRAYQDYATIDGMVVQNAKV